jgi:lipopolysaccharide transport system permease protein
MPAGQPPTPADLDPDYLAWIKVRQHYARSTVQSFSRMIDIGALIGSIGLAYGTLFGQKLSDSLPFLGVGLVQ